MIRQTVPLLAALLCGCTLGPDYAPPHPGAPLAYVPATVAIAAPVRSAWWQLYHDPALNRLVDDAVAANTDLRVAEANFDAARAALRQTQAARLPTTETIAGGTYGRNTTTTQIADAAGREASTTWLYEAGFDMAYEVDLFGRVRRSIEASRADAGAAGAARDAVRIAIVAETVRAYVDACALGNQIAVARTALAIAERQHAIVRRQAAAGGASAFDIARQKEIVARTGATLPTLEGDRRAALFALAALLGRTPDRIPPEAERCSTVPAMTDPVAVGDGAGLLARRPDVREAERKLAAASARIGVAKADLLPRVTLVGSVVAIAPEVSALPDHGSTSFGLGPLISWSFPNIAAVQARIRYARAQDQAAVAHYDGVVLDALKEVEQALARYASAVDHERELVVAEHQARIAFDLAGTREASGAISQLDLSLAEQALIEAQLAVAVADAARSDQLIAVFKALGSE